MSAPTRAPDKLVNELERRIRDGILKEGQTIPTERNLMIEFGTGRNVVREALRILSSRGQIETRPRHRPIVRRVNADSAFDVMGSIAGRLLDQPDGIKNLFNTRIMIEASLVRHAANSASKADLELLHQALIANENAINDSDAFDQTDIEFHGALYEISGNPILPALHRAYASWLAPKWQQTPRMPERNRENYGFHASIFENILMRDPDAAEDALRRHLANAWRQVRSTFPSMHGDDKPTK
ncbi:hypothetical protein A8B83_16375 [Rhodobacteraceae bacterium EhC02]|nr:hypothetical protein A8B83_16375 [Rhodobacteraceae bacterium EhC02]